MVHEYKCRLGQTGRVYSTVLTEYSIKGRQRTMGNPDKNSGLHGATGLYRQGFLCSGQTGNTQTECFIGMRDTYPLNRSFTLLDGIVRPCSEWREIASRRFSFPVLEANRVHQSEKKKIKKIKKNKTLAWLADYR